MKMCNNNRLKLININLNKTNKFVCYGLDEIKISEDGNVVAKHAIKINNFPLKFNVGQKYNEA